MAGAAKHLEKFLPWPVAGTDVQAGRGMKKLSLQPRPPAGRQLDKLIDTLERATRSRTQLPALEATVAGRRARIQRQLWLHQFDPLARQTVSLAQRLGRSVGVGYGIYFTLSYTSALLGVVAGALVDADVRGLIAARACPALDAKRPAGRASTPSVPPRASVLGTAVAPPPRAPDSAYAPPPAPGPAPAPAPVLTPSLRVRPADGEAGGLASSSRATFEGSQRVLDEFDATLFDARHNLVRTADAEAWSGDAWWQDVRAGTAEARAGKLSAASIRARDQVHQLRHLSSQQSLYAARARAAATSEHRQRIAAEHEAIPTLMYRLAAAGVLTSSALVLGSALGALASVVFVFPCAYLIYGSLTARQQRDSKATATAMRCRQEEERQQGFAREHEFLAGWLSQLAAERVAQWREAAALWAQASVHAPTAEVAGRR